MIRVTVSPAKLVEADQYPNSKQHSKALVAKRNEIADILNTPTFVSVADFTRLIKLTEEADDLIVNRPEEIADVVVTLGEEDEDLFPNEATIRNVYIACKRLMEAMCKVQEVVWRAADKGHKLMNEQSLNMDEADRENVPPDALFTTFEDLDEDLKRRAQAIRPFNQLTSFDALREEEEKQKRKRAGY